MKEVFLETPNSVKYVGAVSVFILINYQLAFVVALITMLVLITLFVKRVAAKEGL